MASTLSPPRRARKGHSDTGLRLRHLRLNAGLSPEQLGTQVGVSGNTIRRLEAGVGPRCPHPRTMFLLAQAFEVNVTDIWTVEVPA